MFFINIMKSQQQHSKYPLKHQQQKIVIVAVTWNLFGSLPPVNSLVELRESLSFKPVPDLILFGTQECQRSLCLSLCCEAKAEWEGMLSEVFSQHFLVACHTMGGVHSAILIKHQLKDHFEIDRREKLKAGACNLLGNKGAISVLVTLLGQQFQFINCHLAAHQKETQERNQTINRILDELVHKDLQTDVIFLGDFNYRIDLEEKEYRQMIEGRENTEQSLKYREMLEREQLQGQKELRRDFLLRFEEGPIDFSPTYKMGVSKNEYSRERIPGWTDRIFHRRSHKMVRTSYSCEEAITGSDHRPVIARYVRPIEEPAFSVASDNFLPVRIRRDCQLI